MLVPVLNVPSRSPVPRNADTFIDASQFWVYSRPRPQACPAGSGAGPLSSLLPSPHPSRRLVYGGLTLGQELICLLLSGWVAVKEAEES